MGYCGTETYFYNEDQSYSLQIIQDKDGKLKGVQLMGTNFFERKPG
ncbi:MAG TPA: hypothetical protein VHD83_24755 [Puia sp.]|nr:hypothetical protein [Puia sp.]